MASFQQSGAGRHGFGKARGPGMGVKLTRATLSRLGGSLTLRNREPSGVEALIELPIEPLAAAARSSAKPGVAA